MKQIKYLKTFSGFLVFFQVKSWISMGYAAMFSLCEYLVIKIEATQIGLLSIIISQFYYKAKREQTFTAKLDMWEKVINEKNKFLSKTAKCITFHDLFLPCITSQKKMNCCEKTRQIQTISCVVNLNFNLLDQIFHKVP